MSQAKNDTALLVVDVQNLLVDYLPPRRADELCRNINVLLDKARASRIPVVYVQHNDDDLIPDTGSWQIAPAIAPRDSEAIVHKRFRDAFRETNLADVLEGLGARHLVVCGMQTEFCVDATVREAERRGYRVTLVSDAHATYDVEDASEESIIAQVERVLRGEIAEIVPAAQALEPLP
jgi:nicotinamidase-related amidase